VDFFFHQDICLYTLLQRELLVISARPNCAVGKALIQKNGIAELGNFDPGVDIVTVGI